MSKKPVMGISLPIAFYYNYRGEHYCEIDVYFSFLPISINQIDLIAPGTRQSKELQYLLKNGHGIFDALIPYKTEEINTSESILGLYSSYKSSIGCVDKNPTTATIRERLGMMPCTQNNLSTFLGCFSPKFYLCIRNEKLSLMVAVDGKYREIPSQLYSPSCSQGYGHRTIVIVGQALAKSFDAINWQGVFKDINDYAITQGVEPALLQ